MNARNEAVEMIRRICPPHLSAEEYGQILAEKFEAHRTEVLHAAADKLVQSADEAEAAVVAHYGHGIGRGSADMLRLAAKDLRRMADEAGTTDTLAADEPVTEYGVLIPATDDEPEAVLYITTDQARAQDERNNHRAVFPFCGQTLVQRTVTFGPWTEAGDPRG